jgi:hypothetical protein
MGEISSRFAAWGFADANSPGRRRELDEQRQTKLAEEVAVQAGRREFDQAQLVEGPPTLGKEAAIDTPMGKRCIKCNDAMSAVISTIGPYASRLHWRCVNPTCDGAALIEDNLFPAHSLPGRTKSRSHRPGGGRRRR